MGRILSVNVGERRQIGVRRGQPWISGIDKRPISGRIALDAGGHRIGDDVQVATDVHGGPDKAVYAYAREDTDWWETQLERTLGPGAFGENLTLEGVDCTGAIVGERWRIGDALLEVSQPRLPCATLAKFHDRPTLVKEFAKAERPGAYLRILEPAELGAGDAITVEHRPAHGVTVGLVSRAMLIDHALAARALQAPQLAESIAVDLRPMAARAKR